MSLNLIAEIWHLLRESIPEEFRSDNAHSVVEYLLNEGYDISDMGFEFDHDRYLKSAVKFYAENTDDLDESEESEEDLYRTDYDDDDPDGW